MSLLTHLFLFLLSAAVIWFFSGILVDAVGRVARRFRQNGFSVAFFVLGLLTSISEISVLINSTLNQVPGVSAGNLSGASFVILLFIVPFLAVVGNGVQLRHTLPRWQLALALFVILIPTVFLLDGYVSLSEALVSIMGYGVMLYLIRSNGSSVAKVVEGVEEELLRKAGASVRDFLKIAGGAGFILLAGHVLVNEAVYVANYLSVPASMIALLLLSVGTNVPELVIAFRAILKKRTDIAFGDYLGSAVTNTAAFGVLGLLNPGFQVEASEFLATAVLMTLGFIGFYFFAVSKNKLTRREGVWLLCVYGLFLVVQVINLFRFASS